MIISNKSIRIGANVSRFYKYKKNLLFIILSVGGLVLNSPESQAKFQDSIENVLNLTSRKYQLIHINNLNTMTDSQIMQMMHPDYDPFGKNNYYSYLILIDRQSGDTLFNNPSPAYTYIYISNDQKHIICLSEYWTITPYHIVMYKINGEVIYTRHISPIELKLTLDEFNVIVDSFPSFKVEINSKNRVYRKNSTYYVDFLRLNTTNKKDSVFKYIEYLEVTGRITGNHVVDAVLSSGSLPRIRFYKENDPSLKVFQRFGRVNAIYFKGTDGSRYKIKL